MSYRLTLLHLLLPTLTFGWGGTKYSQITAEAVRVMPGELPACPVSTAPSVPSSFDWQRGIP